MSPLDALHTYFGYDDFRPKQQEIIESVLAGKDTLALLPTGGGKSLCFQVPTLVMAESDSEGEGLCLVVTPLIALMKDQVANLRRRNILATAIYTGMSREEQRVAFDNCLLDLTGSCTCHPNGWRARSLSNVWCNCPSV